MNGTTLDFGTIENTTPEELKGIDLADAFEMSDEEFAEGLAFLAQTVEE